MKKLTVIITTFIYSGLLMGCGSESINATLGGNDDISASADGNTANGSATAASKQEPYDRSSRISDVMADPVFGSYGRLIFPVERGYWSGETLGSLRLTYYNNIDPDKTVEIANYLHDKASDGQTIFYDIYTNAEKANNAGQRLGDKGSEKR